MDFQTVYRQYQPQLIEVEALLQSSIQSHNVQLTEAANQLLGAGGKRIRPLFALICGQFGKSNARHVQAIAGALELIHMATLVHDDVIDHAALRRGRPTVRAQFGNRSAMYTGDFLFARAIQLLSSVDNAEVHREMSEAMVRMCEGEIEQIRDFYNWQQSIRTYLRRIERKTALLIAVSCSLGAMVASAPATTVLRLRRFGYFTGMAFQIIDDVLDFTGTEDVVGKPVGGDLRQGNLTLPSLFVIQNESTARELERLVVPQMDDESAARALKIVQDSDALSKARDLAIRYLDKAREQLNAIPDEEVKKELIIVAEFVNQRLF